MEAAPSIPEVLGGMIVGLGLGLILYGITLAQSYVYMLNCEDDRSWMKWTVATIFVLETLHTHPELISEIHWSVGTILFSSNAIAALVEAFYIRRQWILSKSYILTIGTSILLLVRIGVHIAVSIETYLFPTWQSFHEKRGLNALVQTTLGLGAAVDAVLAASMVYYLRREKSTYTGAKGIITWMMMYAVHSGLILMAVSLAVVITFVCLKHSLLFTGFIAIVGKLYANSLLGTLNARQVFRSKNSDPIVKFSSNAIQLSSMHQRSMPSRPELRVEISQETSMMSDKHMHRDLKSPQVDV
ncbi:unnamed protein product [Somion occarium]|uniref:DUF6534 domain-containing protein n=1 Tax=Somion occarium TaxID=3059160 RepID=A0ABP1D427_9APHY